MASPQKENGYTALSNEIVEKLAKYRISGEEWQILLVVLRKTYGWQKTEDCISLSQFVDMTGLKRSNVVRSIHKLVSKKILGSINNDTTYITKYWFIKDYDNWKASIKKDTSINNDTTPSINNDTKTSINNDTHKRNKQTIQKKEMSGIKPDHVLFVDLFSKNYLQATGNTYQTNAKDFVNANRLIKTHTLDVVKLKAKILYDLCANKSIWFTKDGFSVFTISTLTSKFNEIVKQEQEVEL